MTTTIGNIRGVSFGDLLELSNSVLFLDGILSQLSNKEYVKIREQLGGFAPNELKCNCRKCLTLSLRESIDNHDGRNRTKAMAITINGAIRKITDLLKQIQA